jgi:hypothetical protein
VGETIFSVPLIVAELRQVVTHNWALFSILLTLLFLAIVPALILAKYVPHLPNILKDSPPPL